ncbi:MFS transporter [Caulobacter sp. CCUG 60055]|uniref:peptide MFS transporter n=1 Tax=Caulobacter sp. CCUG 60055 TaxID=2100090 RepID=UPI001FA716EF|nr:peptide MFS transporter [Caulobacter sp. CCUG 60055]MCI3179510.1 MFS transporter [Caulobacter sp. CCUG 60055]
MEAASRTGEDVAASAVSPTTVAPEQSWFGHPRGLTVLFLTEMWENFSFFGMRALLVYYMTKQLMIDQRHASLVYGLYTASVFFTPIVGGVISDRWLGRRRAVLIGSAVMALGHFMMASEALLYPALAVIALGNGLFLPSLPSQVKGLYRPGDPRAGVAYNVYYVGINLGSFLAPLVCGTLGEFLGWHWGFGAAGIGMLAGLVIYAAGKPYLPADPPRGRAAREAQAGDGAQGEGAVARLLLLAGVAATVVLFRIAYEQTGNTIALWADEAVDRRLTAGWSVPMTWFQSLNPMLVFLLTPPLIAAWARAAGRGREPSTMRKMATGAAIVAVSYLVLAGASFAAHGDRVSWIWLAAFFALLTAGELFILPVGLGLFGSAAPAGMAATTIALWFLAAFFGNLLAGALGSLWQVIDHGWFFMILAATAAAAGVVLLRFERAVARIDDRFPTKPPRS